MSKKKYILKWAGVFLIVIAMFLSTTSLGIDNTLYKIKQNVQINKLSPVPLSDKGLLDGYKIILDETFKNDTFPSSWTQDITNPSATWMIEGDNDLCHSKPYYAVCYFDNSPQDEWLMTPILNFSTYTEIKCSFYWMMSWWYAVHEDNCDLNLSISIDGGETWSVFWNEDQYISNQFDDYVWYDTDFENHIDLSEYAGENEVIIGIQYNGSGEDGCIIYFEDITIYGDDPSPNPLICNAGGYYEGKAAETIYFYGEASGGQKPYVWRWDFGDGTFVDWRKNPTHKYYEVATFNVTLRVDGIDKSIDFNKTKVTVGKPEQGPPRLKIVNISGGLGIQAAIRNDGWANATEVEWEIHSRGGPGNVFDKRENGSFEMLAIGDSKDIRMGYFIGIGRIHIKITATTAEVEALPRERDAFKFGPFVIGLH